MGGIVIWLWSLRRKFRRSGMSAAPARHQHVPVFVVIALLVMAALACSLKRQEEKRTPTATPYLTPTFVRPGSGDQNGSGTDTGTNGESGITPPTVQIIVPEVGTFFTVNQEVTVRAIARHEIGPTQALFYVGKDDAAPTPRNSQLLTEQPEIAFEFKWKPTEVGTYTLRVEALRGDARSEPSEVRVQVVPPDSGQPAATVDQGPCTAKAVVQVAIRGGPGTNYSQRGNLDVEEVVDVIGQNNDSTGQGWYKIRRSNGQEGWVNARSEFVESRGGCRLVPVVNP
jgi:hypothetical protein